MFGRSKKAAKARKEAPSEQPERHRRAEDREHRDIDVQEYMRRLVNDSE